MRETRRPGISDNSVEKSFLYLVVFSLVVHVAAFVGYLYLPQPEKKAPASTPIMVDLGDLPALPPANTQDNSQQAKHQAEKRQRVQREMAPRGDRGMTKSPPPPLPPQAARPPVSPPQNSQVRIPQPPAPAPQQTRPREGDGGEPAMAAGQGVVKQERSVPPIGKLFPSSQRLAKLEEGYRKQYEGEVAEGNAHYLNTDDILFGSFLRRFETAVYGAWRYPPDAVRLGIEGVTPVKITFARNGSIVKVEVLSSSGSSILDQEVVRALKELGPIGPLPKNFNKDEFHLIAFFQYGIVRGASRGVIR